MKLLTLAEHKIESLLVERDSELWQQAESLLGLPVQQKRCSFDTSSFAFEFVAEKKDSAIEFRVQAGYYVGFDWVIADQLGVHVVPKLDQEERMIDILAMLRAALTDRENLEHLGDLVEIDFKQPPCLDALDACGLELFLPELPEIFYSQQASVLGILSIR